MVGVNFNEVIDGTLKYSKSKPNFNAFNLKKLLKDRIAEEIALNNGNIILITHILHISISSYHYIIIS